MKKIFLQTLILLLAATFLTISGAAQNNDTGEEIKNAAVFEVRLPITVLDKKKQFVGDLKKSDFIVFENNKKQEITFFSDEKTSPPVYVGVLMDTSPSTRTKMPFSKQAAKNFIYSVVRLRKDKAAFLTFDHEIKLRQDFTEKLDLLDKAVESVKGTGQQTSLYDAVYRFCDEKLTGIGGRRMVVVISDGEDTFSRASLNDVIEAAQRTETVVFTVSTKGGFLGGVPGVEGGMPKNTGDKVLEKLASETGGQAFFTGDADELDNAFVKISQELRSQYVLTYRPADQEFDGKERRIEVRLADEKKSKDYKIRTKKKYRAVKTIGK